MNELEVWRRKNILGTSRTPGIVAIRWWEEPPDEVLSAHCPTCRTIHRHLPWETRIWCWRCCRHIERTR